MSAVSDILLAPDVRPFAVAAAIMVALGGIELLTMLVGFSISELIGKDFAHRSRQPQRPRRPVPLDQCGTPAAVDPDHPGARRVLDRGIPAARHRARRRHRRAGLDRRACRRGRQPAGDPHHQPRHRPHHPARRDLCGGRGRFRRPRRRGFDRAARPGIARPRPSQGCLRQLASLCRHAPAPIPRRFRSAPACCWSTATPKASSPFPHPPTSLRNNNHQTGHKTCGNLQYPSLLAFSPFLLSASCLQNSTGVRRVTKPMSAPASAARKSCSTAARSCCRFSIRRPRSI